MKVTRRYILVGRGDNPGIYLKNVNGKSSLFKGPDVKHIVDVSEVEVCRLINKDIVSAIFVDKKIKKPVDTVKFELGKPIEWPAYHAIVCFGIKTQIVQVANSFDENHKAEQEFTLRLLGLIEPQMTRGLDYESWIGEKNEK